MTRFRDPSLAGFHVGDLVHYSTVLRPQGGAIGRVVQLTRTTTDVTLAVRSSVVETTLPELTDVI